MIGTMLGHWHGWHESIPSCWDRCGIGSAQAQLHLTVIRARAELVSATNSLGDAARGLVKSYGQRLPKCGTYQVSEKLARD